MGDMGEEEWNMYYRTLKLFHETKLREFQYKINNKILVTNSFLFKIIKLKIWPVVTVMSNQKKIIIYFLDAQK